MSKIKEQDRLLKTAREKPYVTYKGSPATQSPDFSAEVLQARGSSRYQSTGRQEPTAKNAPPSRVVAQNGRGRSVSQKTRR